MSPEDLRERIRVAATKFTDDVIAVFAEAFASVAADFASTPRTRGAKAVVQKGRSGVAAKKGVPSKLKKTAEKRARRSGDQLDKLGEQVVKLLTANKKGLRVEEINKSIASSTRELMRPIQKLLGEGKIKKAGERRATTYFVA